MTTTGVPADRPIRTRVQHLNVQVADLGDVAQSYRRVSERGFDMALAVRVRRAVAHAP
jgi:hypothetical protein